MCRTTSRTTFHGKTAICAGGLRFRAFVDTHAPNDKNRWGYKKTKISKSSMELIEPVERFSRWRSGKVGHV